MVLVFLAELQTLGREQAGIYQKTQNRWLVYYAKYVHAKKPMAKIRILPFSSRWLLDSMEFLVTLSCLWLQKHGEAPKLRGASFRRAQLLWKLVRECHLPSSSMPW